VFVQPNTPCFLDCLVSADSSFCTVLIHFLSNPALICQHKNYQFSPTTKDPQVSKSALNSLLSKDPQNPFMALKEAISSLNKKVNLLFSIYTPLPTIISHSAIKSLPRTHSSTLHDMPHTNKKYDTISSQNLPDIYKLMITLPPMTYNPLTHLHELAKHTLTVLPTSLQMNSQETTNSNNNLSAISYYIVYYSTGIPDTLQ